MTQEELIKEIEQLPLDQQAQLLKIVSERIRDEKRSIVNRLHGIAKPDGPMPSDEEIKADYIRYLEEKYS